MAQERELAVVAPSVKLLVDTNLLPKLEGGAVPAAFPDA